MNKINKLNRENFGKAWKNLYPIKMVVYRTSAFITSLHPTLNKQKNYICISTKHTLFNTLLAILLWIKHLNACMTLYWHSKWHCKRPYRRIFKPISLILAAKFNVISWRNYLRIWLKGSNYAKNQLISAIFSNLSEKLTYCYLMMLLRMLYRWL